MIFRVVKCTINRYQKVRFIDESIYPVGPALILLDVGFNRAERIDLVIILDDWTA